MGSKNYIIMISNTTNKEDIKKIVRLMFSDNTLDDIDFNEIIYNFVIPKLKVFGCDMSYDEKTNTTNYEKVMREMY